MRKKIALFIILFSNIVFSQTLGQNYTVKWVNTDNGLKQLSVRYCIPDDYGFVWIGTELGLYRYDGYNLKEIVDEKYPSLSKQRITRLGKDSITGKIYLQTSPEDYQYVIDHNTIKRIPHENKWDQAIFTFNGLCFTTSNPLIQKLYRNPKVNRLLKDYSNITELTTCITSNFIYLPQYEQLVISTRNGSIKYLDYKFPINLILMQFGENVLAAKKGKFILLSEGKISSKKIMVDDKIQKYIDRELTKLSDIEIFGSKNKYYLKYKGGIYKILFNNNTLSTKFLFKCPSEDITSISHLDKEDIYFIGTRTHGMAILKPILFNSVLFDNSNSNKSINYCYAVAAISNYKWYSPSGWSFNPETKKAQLENYLIDYCNNHFILAYKNKFYIDSKNDLWDIETHKNNYDFIYPKSKKPNLVGFSGYTYHKGELCLSDPNSIYFLQGKTFKTDPSLNRLFIGKPINSICSIQNRIIILTAKGVYSYIPETKKVSVLKGLQNVNARYIKLISKTRFWIGCYGEGLYLVDKNKIYKVIDKNIELNTAHAVEEDSKGNLWISTNDGLLKINKKIALTKILSHQAISCYKYSIDDGLLTNEFNGGGTHPSLHTENGLLGFTSMKGFVWFNPNRLEKHPFKGSIIIDQVTVDNKKIVNLINNHYIIPKEAKLLTFNFNYGYYFNRENLSISYHFDDQTNWTEIKGNSFQIGRYKSGIHKLLIKITTHGFKDQRGVIKIIPLEFEERYYESFWFWFLISGVFTLLLLVAYQIGLKLNKRREDTLKEKIEEKTLQLQDSINELAISKDAILNSLQEKNILLKEVHHRVKNNLQLIISMLNIQARRNNYDNIEDFLQKGETRISSMALIHQSLYQSEESLDQINFQNYVEDLVHSISKTFDIGAEKIGYDINANEIVFNLTTAIPLGLIINELVTNSLKYGYPNGKTGTISIIIQHLSNDFFELIVEDDGIGFDQKKLQKKSFGLELIKLLANQLNGSVAFESNAKTTYRITFEEIVV